MKIILLFAFSLPLLSACASSPADADADAAASSGPKQYLTGSIIPSHAKKASGDQSNEPLLPASYGSTITPYVGPGNGVVPGR
ncbi:hypothetical protein [Collimonas pratensis]|uniref:Lipoprotein n=1 Tax=Collimonas pratensis TaxID=279113 RepID=A0ABM5Z9P1_9BURK|nr:hypothetical protein [Collimonas pratensis]AMP15827.1 putative lipoprotein [Collimonas pratensis]NKI70130.1 hypothetical protein [Collimonas pratensis]